MLRLISSLVTVLIMTCAAAAQPATGVPASPGRIVFVTFDFPGAVATRGYGINNKAEIVGSYDDDQFNTFGFFMNAQGKLRQMDPFHADYVEADGINDESIIVGTFQNSPQFGFAFAAGQYYPIGFGGEINFAAGINKHRDIVGAYADVCCHLHGFLFRKGQPLTTIDYPGAIRTAATAISDVGVIVGTWVDPGIVTHGFKLENDVMTAIDVPGAAETLALGINSAGTIVGYYLEANGSSHGFLLRSGVFQTVDVPDATSSALSGINDVGMIVGDYTDVNGVQHGFFARR